jgi:hypothetical protein
MILPAATRRPRLRPPRSRARARSLPRTAVDARVVPPVADQANASENAEPDQPVDACLIPSQLLAAELLRRPIEPAQFTSWAFSRRAKASGAGALHGAVGDCFDTP